jgi:hypothetical protein
VVDSTTVAVGAFGLAGTTIGFAGPSWNEERIQRARERRDGRTAPRLVAAEVAVFYAGLEVVAEEEDLARTLEAGKGLTGYWPGMNQTQWIKYEATLAIVLDDEVWNSLAAFYASLGLVLLVFKGNCRRRIGSMTLANSRRSLRV